MKKYIILLIVLFLININNSVADSLKRNYFTVKSMSNPKDNNSYIISGKVTFFTLKDKNPKELKNIPIYIIGPKYGPNKNRVFHLTRTDDNGVYSTKVKFQGYYDTYIPLGWAYNNGIVRQNSLSTLDKNLFVDNKKTEIKSSPNVIKYNPEGYVIKDKIVFFDENGKEIPVQDVLVYIKGPFPISKSNNIFRCVRTDQNGFYTLRVKEPGIYEVRLDYNKALNKGLDLWTPDVNKVLVK